MKKVMIALMMAVTTSTACFANASNDDVQKAAKEVAQAVKKAPSGTTYGVVEVTNNHIVVNTPLGRHTIHKMRMVASRSWACLPSLFLSRMGCTK